MKTLLAKLDPRYPQGFTTAGATLFFRSRLAWREAKRAFDLFPIVEAIETPDGYWVRSDCYQDDPAGDPSCGAFQARLALRRLNY